ncbi:MAG: COX15/CtaA family protein [Robiginitomaculum sp.]
MSSFSRARRSKLVGAWLFFVVLLVIAMVLVGGATRLTNSGLSITEWRPVSGSLPPLSSAAWLSEFEKYKRIPEFLAENPDMNLRGFKFIYFMEWSHRQLGRFIGLFYLLPMLLFMGTGRIAREKRGRFIGVFLLICMQGAIGWWMVSSGLKDRIDVSQYRLATHLGLAFIILSILFWTWLDQRQGWPARLMGAPLKKHTSVLFSLVFLQLIAGAFVAGTHAGRTYNTWPLMDGGIAPSGYFTMMPKWINIFENVAAIQFNHRMLGYVIFLASIWVWGTAKSKREVVVAKTSGWFIAAILLQICLGIIALLKVVELPYALLHQAGGILVLLMAVWTLRSARVSSF